MNSEKILIIIDCRNQTIGPQRIDWICSNKQRCDHRIRLSRNHSYVCRQHISVIATVFKPTRRWVWSWRGWTQFRSVMAASFCKKSYSIIKSIILILKINQSIISIAGLWFLPAFLGSGRFSAKYSQEVYWPKVYSSGIYMQK